MRPGFPLNVSSGGYAPLAALSAVVLAISVAASLLFAPSQGNRDAAGAESVEAALQLRFKDAGGTALTLTDFRGRSVLLNVWATWCGPCRKEMPALDRLQAKLGATDFEVIALSIDRGGLGVVERFFDEISIANLAIYLDENAAAMSALGITGIPTTLLIDREGRGIRRWAGPAEWDSPEIEALIRSHVDLATSSIESPASNLKVKQWTALPATRL